ncbi:CatA-like O-acetyltransferase [Dysosmobacter sp.]|uniref:CatA-like O-acetyltransferase n=1 Tax=Dysosmobacter sp. TaxID=2591382 RepID=UPI002A8F93D5|nr:CatA-like O-acetyltransferase [Dysosmobacter sp.]MDY3986283.1 CatA-like O-acetyltransferase [Dysosmobacter sp.]
MNYRVIDMGRDPRRAQYDYFRSLANPYAGVTVNVDITALLDWTKRTGSNFFLTVLYAVSRAANSVPELRRRIRGEQVVEYVWCPTSHTVALADGSYCYCTLTADMSLADFLPYAKEAQEMAKKEPTLDDG